MNSRRWQNKLRQSFYKPGRSRFFTKEALKDLKEMDQKLEKNLGMLLGKKWEKKYGKKKKKDDEKEK